jgi:hypothetical protein
MSCNPIDNNRNTDSGKVSKANLTTNAGVQDVILGRGLAANNHPGNQVFRKIIQERKREYSSSSRRQLKDNISKEIFNVFQSKGVRFLREVKTIEEADNLGLTYPLKSRTWLIVDDETIVHKIKQALREIISTSKKKDSQIARSQIQSTNDGRDPVPVPFPLPKLSSPSSHQDSRILTDEVTSSTMQYKKESENSLARGGFDYYPSVAYGSDFDMNQTERNRQLLQLLSQSKESDSLQNSRFLQGVLPMVHDSRTTSSMNMTSKSVLESILMNNAAAPAQLFQRSNDTQNISSPLSTNWSKPQTESHELTTNEKLRLIIAIQQQSSLRQATTTTLHSAQQHPRAGNNYELSLPLWPTNNETSILSRHAEILPSTSNNVPSVGMTTLPSDQSLMELLTRNRLSQLIGIDYSDRGLLTDNMSHNHHILSELQQQQQQQLLNRILASSTHEQSNLGISGHANPNLLADVRVQYSPSSPFRSLDRHTSTSPTEDDIKPAAKY